MLEEPLILVLCHLTLVTVPNRLQVVNELPIQLDWEVNEQRVLFEDFFDFGLSGELSGLSFKLKDNLSASFKVQVVNSGDFILTTAIGYPTDTLPLY